MTDRPLSRGKTAVFSIVSVGIGLAAALVVGEIAVRWVGRVDAHGTFHVRSHRIEPFRYEGQVYQEVLDRWQAERSDHLRYDPLLGWVYRHHLSDTELPPALQGIYRDTAEYRLTPQEGLLRIVLVGDSFTRGTEVGYYDSWGYMMQGRLKALGVAAEVLNLGAGGYGIDQAYLRWTTQGRALLPDVLIFGFQPENLLPGLNVFRPIYMPRTAIPWTKPRFVLCGDSLVLHNLPTIEPEDIPAFVDGFWGSPLSDHEAFRRREDEHDSLWRRSRLLASVATIGRRKILDRPDHPESTFSGVNTQAGRVGLELLARFEREASADRVPFLVLHLPRVGVEVAGLLEGTPLGYLELLDTIEARHTVIDPLDPLLEEALLRQDPGSMKMPGGHYSPLANRIVGEYAADAQAGLILSGRLELERLGTAVPRP
jgi:hypothetical protein